MSGRERRREAPAHIVPGASHTVLGTDHAGLTGHAVLSAGSTIRGAARPHPARGAGSVAAQERRDQGERADETSRCQREFQSHRGADPVAHEVERPAEERRRERQRISGSDARCRADAVRAARPAAAPGVVHRHPQAVGERHPTAGGGEQLTLGVVHAEVRDESAPLQHGPVAAGDEEHRRRALRPEQARRQPARVGQRHEDRLDARTDG